MGSLAGTNPVSEHLADRQRTGSADSLPVVFRKPCAEDGSRVARLISDCPPLDPNSVYCNLLQCTHFADTCVVAECEGRLVGWVSAYRPPLASRQIFVWQVAVDDIARGSGLGGRMLDVLIARLAPESIGVLAATITESNAASWALFSSFARRHGARLSRRPIFDRGAHFAGAHETEHLVTIDLPVGISRRSEEEI